MYGVLLLTILYGIFAFVATETKECIEEPCNSEGLDSSTVGFATDGFIAGVMILLGLFLYCTVRKNTAPPRRCAGFQNKAAWTLIFMGLGYVLGGLGHSLYPNSGADDNLGQQEFFLTWSGSFTFMTLSVWQTYSYIGQTLQVMEEPQHYLSLTSQDKGVRRLKRFLTIAFWLNMIAWAATAGGYLWCATVSDIHTDDAIDNAPELDNPEEDRHECLNVAVYGEVGWYISFAIFWIPAGFSFRRMILAATEGAAARVYGLPLMWAAAWTVIIPWTFGIMFVVWVGAASIIMGENNVTDLYSDIYAAVVYHFGMLLHYFLFHNLALGLHRIMVLGGPNQDVDEQNGVDPAMVYKEEDLEKVVIHEPPSIIETPTAPSHEEDTSGESPDTPTTSNQDAENPPVAQVH